MNAKEWLIFKIDGYLEEYGQTGHDDHFMELQMEEYASYKTKELEDKIKSFRDKLTKCMDEHYSMEDDNTNIFTEAMGWRKEFDKHFNLKDEN